MTVADIMPATFTLCNSLRVLAYVPQIAKVATDRSGVEAISFSTWDLFLYQICRQRPTRWSTELIGRWQRCFWAMLSAVRSSCSSASGSARSIATGF